MFAHVTGGVVDSTANPPQLTYQDGRWWDLRDRDLATLALVGWYPVQEVSRPADTASTTWDAVYTFNVTVVVQSWVERPKTAEEIATATAAAEREAARVAIRAIVNDLQAEKDRCDVVLAKTAAQITGGDTKDVARAAKRIADAAIDLAKFLRD